MVELGGPATPNVFAYLALVLWVPITLWLFKKQRPELAAVLGVIGGRIFLPERTEINLPILPDINKETISTLAVVLGCVIWAKGRLSAAKPFSGVDRLFLLLLIGDVGTYLTNHDVVFANPESKHGLTVYDTITIILSDIVIVYLTFLVGRAMFRSDRALRIFLFACMGLGLAYVPLCLIEIRLSPQLHNWIYGFIQHDFSQTVRGGGFRPMVFLTHGIVLARFMLVATLSGVLLARAKMLSGRMTAALWGLIVVFVACKSTGAILLGLAFGPLIFFGREGTQRRVSIALVCIVALYPMLRAGGLIPIQAMEDWANEVSAERGSSLTDRFNAEETLLKRARERPAFGWGGYGRSRAYDPVSGDDMATPDGEWIVVLGVRGAVGFVGSYGLYLLPVLLALRTAKRLKVVESRMLLHGLALITVILAVDTLPNSSSSLPHFFWSGALCGLSQGLLRQERLARFRALRARSIASRGPIETVRGRE